MTRYSDAALLKGDYAGLAAELRTGARKAPDDGDWQSAACDNEAEAAAQEVARHIFAMQQTIDDEAEQLEITVWSTAGPLRVLALIPGEGDLIRIDGVMKYDDKPVAVIQHTSQLALTFQTVELSKDGSGDDDGLRIGFVIFDELKERQKSRYGKRRKPRKKKTGTAKTKSRK